jgi:hypothetical protein
MPRVDLQASCFWRGVHRANAVVRLGTCSVSRPQTIKNVKALLEANDVAIDRALGVLHANGSINLVEGTDVWLVETFVQARWSN